MKQIFPALFFVLVTTFAFAQRQVVVSIRAADTKLPIAFATIETEQGTSYANKEGMYVWHVSASNQIQITNWNFADTVLNAENIGTRDSIFVLLKPEPEQLDEVLVQSGNSWLSHTIFGFERWQGGWVFLLRKKLIVADNKLDKKFETVLPKVNKKWPRQLYADVNGNTFLVWPDSVQQFTVSNGAIHFYPKYKKAILNLQVKPVLMSLPGGMVYRETVETKVTFTSRSALSPTEFESEVRYPPLHNCGALVKFKNRDTTLTIAASVDQKAYGAAQEAFGKYASLSIRYWSVFEDSGYFNTGIRRAMGHALHSYKTQFSLPKQVYFLPADNNQYQLFEPYAEQLIRFDENLEEISRLPFNFEDCPREDYLFVDASNAAVWLRRRVKGLDVLYAFTGANISKSGIPLDAFVTNIRVHNGVALYINQYGDLQVKQLANQL